MKRFKKSSKCLYKLDISIVYQPSNPCWDLKYLMCPIAPLALQLLTVSWVRGDLGQHAPRLAEQECKREPELSQDNRLGREQHVILLQTNGTATQMFVLVST